MNTPKKLDFWTAAIFQLEVKTTVYRKQKHENALLIALPFKDFVITSFSLQYFASEFISLCVRTFAVHPAMWPCWDATISQLSVVSNVLKWLNNGSSVTKPHNFFLNSSIEHLLLCLVVVNTYILLCVKLFFVGRVLKWPNGEPSVIKSLSRLNQSDGDVFLHFLDEIYIYISTLRTVIFIFFLNAFYSTSKKTNNEFPEYYSR